RYPALEPEIGDDRDALLQQRQVDEEPRAAARSVHRLHEEVLRRGTLDLPPHARGRRQRSKNPGRPVRDPGGEGEGERNLDRHRGRTEGERREERDEEREKGDEAAGGERGVEVRARP